MVKRKVLFVCVYTYVHACVCFHPVDASQWGFNYNTSFRRDKVYLGQGREQLRLQGCWGLVTPALLPVWFGCKLALLLCLYGVRWRSQSRKPKSLIKVHPVARSDGLIPTVVSFSGCSITWGMGSCACLRGFSWLGELMWEDPS